MFREVDEFTIIIHGHDRTPSSIRELLLAYFTERGFIPWDAELASQSAVLNLAYWSESAKSFAHDCTLHKDGACGLSDVEPVVSISSWRRS